MNGCVSLWIGESLGAVERACLRSVLRQGHRLTLYCYGAVAGVPEGVIVKDAGGSFRRPRSSATMPGASAISPTGSATSCKAAAWAHGSTRTSICCGRSTRSARISSESRRRACSTMRCFGLRRDSPILPELLRSFQGEPSRPTWLAFARRLAARLRELARGKADLGRLPWGSTGPQALTALARKYSLMSEALPADVFYPVAWQRAAWILDPRIALQEVVSERTVAVHCGTSASGHSRTSRRRRARSCTGFSAKVQASPSPSAWAVRAPAHSISRPQLRCLSRSKWSRWDGRGCGQCPEKPRQKCDFQPAGIDAERIHADPKLCGLVAVLAHHSRCGDPRSSRQPGRRDAVPEEQSHEGCVERGERGRSELGALQHSFCRGPSS